MLLFLANCYPVAIFLVILWLVKILWLSENICSLLSCLGLWLNHSVSWYWSENILSCCYECFGVLFRYFQVQRVRSCRMCWRNLQDNTLFPMFSSVSCFIICISYQLHSDTFSWFFALKQKSQTWHLRYCVNSDHHLTNLTLSYFLFMSRRQAHWWLLRYTLSSSLTLTPKRDLCIGTEFLLNVLWFDNLISISLLLNRYIGAVQ